MVTHQRRLVSTLAAAPASIRSGAPDRRVLVLCLALVLALGAGASVRAAGTPAWLQSPSVPGFYVGVGMVPATKDDAGDWQKAEEAAKVALAQSILSQVSSEVKSESAEYSRASGSELVSQVTSQNRVSTSLAIPGITVVDRWDDSKHHARYCYVRVPADSVSAFQTRCYEEIHTYVEAEKRAMDTLSVASGMPAYVDRLARLLAYVDARIGAGVVGAVQRTSLAGTEESLRARLADVLSHLAFQAAPAPRVAAKVRSDAVLRGKVTFRDTVLSGLPVTAGFVDGKGFGQIQGRAVSGPDGEIALGLFEINSVRPDNTVEVVPSLYDGLPDSVLALLPPLPRYPVVVESYDGRQAVQCQVTYLHGEGRLALAPLASRIAKGLSDAGYAAREASPATAPAGPVQDVATLLGRKPTGLWVVLEASVTESSVEDGALTWQVDVVWNVLDFAHGREPAKAGTAQLRLSAADESAMRQMVCDRLYTRLAGAVSHAVDDCAH